MNITRTGIYSCDFEYIEKLVKSSESINQLTMEGSSLFTSYLNSYYEDLFAIEELREKEILSWEYDKRGSLYKYQMNDLSERKDGILNRLNWFLEHDVDFNLVDAENEYCETPLSIALWYEDYYMMKFLLEKGADPKVWFTPANERESGADFEMELIYFLDCAMEDACGNRYRNLKKIVWLLMSYGMPVSGVFRFIYEAENEYKDWHEVADCNSPEELSNEELFEKLCLLCKKDTVDIEDVRKYLNYFKPWDEEHSYEKLFSQAFLGRNVELFKMLYEYCPHPDYECDYMSCDVMFDSQYINDYECDKRLDELEGKEQADAIEGGINKIGMIHFMLSHPDAVEEYKYKTGKDDESMMHFITYKLGHEIDEEGKWDIMQLLKVFIELTAYRVFDDFGPTIIKEFDLDRLDEYRMVLYGSEGKWRIFDYDDECVAYF